MADRRVVTHRCEEVTGFAEWSFGFRMAEGKKTAALAEESMRALRNVPESLPARRGVRVKGGCVGVRAGVLRDLGARCD
jgi:hypothetical protein